MRPVNVKRLKFACFSKTVKISNKNHIPMKKYLLTKTAVTLLSFLFIFCFASQAQNSNTQTTNKKYVRIDIGHGALHCPFLSPKLEGELRQLKGVDNFIIDRQTSYITFNLPTDTEITEDFLKKMGTDVGYPGTDVMVKMDNKPIKPATN
jgi:hypothetical protein